MRVSKAEVLAALRKELNKKDALLRKAWEGLRHDLTTDTKSTAGDKHETGRAMTHLELERLGKNRQQLEEQKAQLDKIDFKPVQTSVKTGSLIRTSQGWYLLSIGFGPVKVGAQTVYILSPASPIGKLMQGKKQGECFSFKGQTQKILEVY